MFSDRSGAIGLDELEAAIKNLGLEQTRDELDKIIDEVGSWERANTLSPSDSNHLNQSIK